MASTLVGLQRWSVRRTRPEAGTGALILWCASVVLLSNALNLLLADVQAKLVFARAQVGGVVPVPLFWFYLTLQFTGQDRRITPLIRLLLSTPVVVVLLLLLTDPFHHWMIITGQPLVGGYLARASYSYGLPVWIYAAYGYTQVLVGALVLTWRMIRQPGFRWQGTVLLVAVIVSMAANIMDLASTDPRPAFDTTPLALLLCVPLFIFALVRLQRADLVPVARSTVIETMRDGLLVADNQEQVIDLNPAAALIFGLPLKEARGRRLSEIWPSWGRDGGGLPPNTRPTQTLQMIGGGQSRVFEVTCSRLRDWRGQPSGQVLVLRDTTARREAEQALRASEERLRSMFENTQVGVYQLDPRGRVLFANAAMAHMLGFDSSGTFRRSEPDAAAAMLASDLREGRSRRPAGQGRMLSWRRPNGDVLRLLEHAREVRDAEGNLAYYEGTVEDVTELVEARDDLQRKARYVQALNSVIATGASLTDVSNMLDACLQSAVAALGVQAGAAWAGRQACSAGTFADLWTSIEELGAAFDSRLEVGDLSQVQGDSPLRGVARRLLEGGIQSLLAIPIAKEGRRGGGLAFAAPHARIWRQEEAAFAEAVANEIAAGLHRLEMVEQARHQERLAAVGQLAAGIAHDFNNFLATIVLQAEMLGAEPQLPPGGAARTRTILEQSRRATALISQVLDFSRRSVLEMRPVDLGSLVEEQLRLLGRALPESIRLESAMDDGPHCLQADTTRLQQVMLNLATNARDAMPRGGRLQFSLHSMRLGPHDPRPVADMPDGRWVVLEVSDSGTGMTDEVLSHVFEPFYTTKAPGKGTGLGLSQVYGIVKQHEGFVAVSSRLGVGTTFQLFFPALESGGGRSEAALPGVARGAGETILLVEDNDAMRESASEVLQRLGYRVVAAANGREALARFDAQPERFALVISDVVMPELGGEGLFVELKARRPDLSVILISGYPMGTTGRLLEPTGLVRLQKPLDVHQLAAAIQGALRRDPQSAEPAR
jgi:PAS domain S-box-containing protein